MPTEALIETIISDYGYLAIFVMMFLEGLCIPIPSELTMGFAGYLVYQGKFSLGGAIFAGWLGSFTGSFAIYAAARLGGRKFLYRWGHFVGLGPHRLDKISEWFNRYGPPLIIPWRQIPVVRTKISVAAGLLNMGYIVFAVYTAAGIAVWCGLSACLGCYFGQRWETIITIFTSIGNYVIVALLLIFILAALFLLVRRRKVREIR